MAQRVLSPLHLAIFALVFCSRFSGLPAELLDLTHQPWFEARTTHFHTYSCGPTQSVAKLAARLEQFRLAYSSLAGTQAVASPPIVVIALPDHDTLSRFVPLYHGQPISLAGFFHRASDENLIVLSLSSNDSGGLDTIFHEFAHLLLRHNERVWPIWLTEGMADIYATFEVAGAQSVRIGKPRELYLNVLAHQPLMPLHDLFAVTQDSPQYNEREHQGIFYAESWLLTHFLMSAQNSALRPNLSLFTTLLRKGQETEQAFTNAFQRSLPSAEKQLSDYLHQNRFEPLLLTVNGNLLAAQPMVTRALSPVEISFRLGDALLRVGRLEEAEPYFLEAKKRAPSSPLSYEGLGLLAAERGDHEQALSQFEEAVSRGSSSFLAHYLLAREEFRRTATAPDTYSKLEPAAAAGIRAELQKVIALMPDFAPGHHLLGFFELVQGDDPVAAEQHLQRAVQLEPENESYALTLAQAQISRKELPAARGTLQALCLPNIPTPVRKHAQEMLDHLNEYQLKNR
jgi:tetratricopeptide (TPR) repeat protein